MSLVSNNIKVYGNLKYGKEVRIDDGCIFTGDVEIGDYVHIAPYCVFNGGAGIKIGSFCGFSTFTVIHTKSDDFSGEMLFGPTLPKSMTRVKSVPLVIEDYVLIGVRGTVITVPVLPEGFCLGANSLLLEEPEEWSIYGGSPAAYLKSRKKQCKALMETLHFRV